MNKILTLIIGITLTSFMAVNAQKYAYVDSEYILEQIPEYDEAKTKIDQSSNQWQKEIAKKWEEIEKLKKSFEADKIILPDDIMQKREEEIKLKEQKAREYQNEKFGVDGELMKLRQELIRPWQEKLFEALRLFAEEGRYSFIFDISNQSTLLYADPRYDKSDNILRDMGVKKKKKK